MILKNYIKYIFKYYSVNKSKLFVSVLCLTICYLALEIVISFGTLIENNSQATFKKHFGEASFIISPANGIKFDENGQLLSEQYLESKFVKEFSNHFDETDYSLLTINNQNVNFIKINDKNLQSDLISYCNKNKIKILSSFFVENNKSAERKIMYDVNGVGNRFNLFSFENQISAFILGSELSTDVGVISRLISIFAIVFTFYISLLYFKERVNEFSMMIVHGYTDTNLRIIFIDCILQNIIAFLVSIITLASILLLLTDTISDAITALTSFVYILPYLPVLVIAQLLLLFNRSMKYATSYGKSKV